MKKYVSIVLAALMAASLAACAAAPAAAPAAPAAAPAASAEEAAPAEAASAETPVEAPAETPAVEYPTAKNITVLCAASPGGNTDAQCRIWADYMNRTYSGHNFIVENDGSGNGVVAFEKVRNANPDGSLLLYYHNGLDIMRAIGRYEYSMADFTLLGKMVDEQYAYFLVVDKDSKYQTVEELVNDALANPGAVTFGVQLAASRQMLIGSFLAATGADIDCIDTGAEADTLTQVMGGNVDFSFISYNNSINYQEAGEVRILAYCGDERAPEMPDVPTIKEIYPEFANCFNLPFLLGPAGMDEALADAINLSFKDMDQDETVKESYAKMKQTYTWFDRNEVKRQFEEQLGVIDVAAKALGY
ncbi:MAG: tripartite tricarboxylate transporter substrate binding protein [Firmicutes bacterium]|nr:tripartite tricarboxylate transporter substrate binding protein [Bacillota bacterium]